MHPSNLLKPRRFYDIHNISVKDASDSRPSILASNPQRIVAFIVDRELRGLLVNITDTYWVAVS
jgi:hypothetical protein